MEPVDVGKAYYHTVLKTIVTVKGDTNPSNNYVCCVRMDPRTLNTFSSQLWKAHLTPLTFTL